MSLELFVCIHSIPNDVPTGVTIRAATEARCTPPWVLGPAYPATHAYVAWSHGDGLKYRLDAQPGGAKLDLFRGPAADHVKAPCAWWRVKASPGAIEAGVMKAVAQDGVPYDFLEILPQMIGPLPGLNLPALPPVPFLSRILGKTPALLDLLKGPVICTHLTTRVMEAVGGEVAETARQLSSRFPEALGQALVGRDGLPWLERVEG